MLEQSGDEFLIGVDGGATEVKAHEIVRTSPTLGLGPASASFLYDRARGFRPVPMPTQLLDLEKGAVRPSGLEGAQARLWLEASARAIEGFLRRAAARPGSAAPGRPGDP